MATIRKYEEFGSSRHTSLSFIGHPSLSYYSRRTCLSALHRYKVSKLPKSFASSRKLKQVRFERGTVRYCSCSVLEANLLDSNRVRLSVVVPFYNEADSIEKLVEAVIAACEESPYASQWELICVDDGSTDGTTDKLKRLCDKYPTIKGISFRKNFGQTAALAAGFDIASGDLVATLDGDLQNDPKDIFRLIETMDAGDYDLVSGWRHCREDAFEYQFTIWVAQQSARNFGKSKYGLDRIIRVICDLTFLYYLKKYRTRPSHLVGSLAILFSAFSLGLMVCASISKFLGKRMFRTKLSVWLLFLMTLQLIWIVLVLGILAEVVTRTYYESQNKPIYRVRKYFPEKAKIGFQ
ncbi:Undecaprenyl-phosphate 4-deoxy-4-formamido-L-arabinose transferase [Galdieria sulphuraria]|nr:Undecaprenyl-phosphate 4-deoxy-4-formamido-L-arabinose transferase [Galdieria sulphuraria]